MVLSYRPGIRGSVELWVSAHHVDFWSHIKAWSWGGLVQLGHPSTLYRPTDGQFQLFKGAEEDQVVMEIIRADFVIWILLEPGISWMQAAGKEELGVGIPTVFQGDILDLLNAVRIRRDNTNSVLHTPTQDLMI
jgi:hypothetical protein